MAHFRPEGVELLPVVEVAAGRHVVDQRVEPDVHHVRVVAGHRDPPLQGGSGDGLVAHAPLEEADDLVVAAARHNALQILFVIGQELVDVLRRAEEVALLLHHLKRPFAVGTGFVLAHAALGNVRLAGDAVPPLVLPFIDVALIEELLEDGLHRLVVTLLGGADEVVVGDVERLPEILEVAHRPVGKFARREPLGCGALLNLLSVLVGPGEEENVEPLHPFVPAHRVGGDGRVGMPDVRDVVDVVDRGGEVEALLFVHVCDTSCKFLLLHENGLSAERFTPSG